MNLGNTPKEPENLAQSPATPKVSYPSLSFNDDQAEQFLSTYSGKIGDTVTATVNLTVTGMRHDQYGKSVTFDVTDIEDIEPAGAKDDEDDEGGENGTGITDKSATAGENSDEQEVPGTLSADDEAKVLGFQRKKTQKPVPDMSAAGLRS